MAIRPEERFEDLHLLSFEQLYHLYYKQPGNVVSTFNDAIEKVRKIGIRHFRRRTLRTEMAQFTSFLNTFEAYQRAFFENYTAQKGEGKILADDFLRSSEIYINRANNIVGQISNELMQKDARLAMNIGWAGIVTGCIFSLMSYFFPPKESIDKHNYQKLQKDNIFIHHNKN